MLTWQIWREREIYTNKKYTCKQTTMIKICDLRSHEKRVSDTYRVKDEAKPCAYMYTTLAPTYIQTYKFYHPDEPYYLTTYNFYNRYNSYKLCTPTTLQPTNPPYHTTISLCVALAIANVRVLYTASEVAFFLRIDCCYVLIYMSSVTNMLCEYITCPIGNEYAVYKSDNKRKKVHNIRTKIRQHMTVVSVTLLFCDLISCVA